MKTKPFVKTSVQIDVRPPEGFTFSGDTKIKPQEASEEEEVGIIISDLVNVLTSFSEQTEKLKSVLGKLKKLYPCKGCDK